MNILFLVYHGFSEANGITQKIHYQVKGLRENGYNVHLCYYDFDSRGHRCRFVDGIVIKDYGKGFMAGLRQRLNYDCVLNYCRQNAIQFVYARSFQNASPWLIGFFHRLNRLGIKSVTEIPTYPYDDEFAGFSIKVRMGLKIDQLFRNSLAKEMAAMVTFSDADKIFGQRTIRISNGVDLDSIPIHKYQHPIDDSIHLIGVAEVHYWHGYDRLIEGLGKYYQEKGISRKVFFHIVGGIGKNEMYGSVKTQGIKKTIDHYGLSEYVVLHGQLYGKMLDAVFDQCCFAIGSLARHRSGITVIKTLKNREYATRGIPFIYSEQDSDFDNQPYVLKALPDESPIDIQQIIDFVDTHRFNPNEIRETVEHLSWKLQMKQVVDKA